MCSDLNSKEVFSSRHSYLSLLKLYVSDTGSPEPLVTFRLTLLCVLNVRCETDLVFEKAIIDFNFLFPYFGNYNTCTCILILISGGHGHNDSSVLVLDLLGGFAEIVIIVFATMKQANKTTRISVKIMSLELTAPSGQVS